ncbi:cell wall elongation regulator TseB-like domain-containing protein [Pontibacillus litoralis]|uniref:Cell wall elongation regulator TseB-like domain-containing protein n=1 Tax=Pontibacillus litoralis JSM 072002 TaxID=1385512 RepID=A0A0A5GAB1_9BACI|nr:DUF5590 domain-containing protein [Pontibacillus litoralis]KGX88025.1 hypothetical protein N784_12625 [Pontibacillus litoralis JSM 072002]
MKRQQFSPSTERSYLAYIVWGIAIIAIIVVVYFLYMYIQIMQDKTATFTESKEIAINQTQLTRADDVLRYHGSSRYDIVTGIAENEEKAFVFIPIKDKKTKPIFVSSLDVISEEQMLNAWKQDCTSCRLETIQPAYEKQGPLWEITYTDEDNRYVIKTYQMKDGNLYDTLYFNQ